MDRTNIDDLMRRIEYVEHGVFIRLPLDPYETKLDLLIEDVAGLSDTEWNLLGQYIAYHTHLKEIKLASIGLTDANIVQLFQELTKSSSIEVLNFGRAVGYRVRGSVLNNFGAEGIRSMSPFLQNSAKLKAIVFSGSTSMDTAAFDVLVNILNGGPIEELVLCRCSITDISALGTVTLPHLKSLYLTENNIQNISTLENYTNLTHLILDKNNIGIDRCQSVARLLQNEDSNLTLLNLNDNGIDDEGIKILTTSLKHNKKLSGLCLKGNSLQPKGYRAILKLLLDLSSIENTYNSNHTITTLEVEPSISSDETRIKRMKEYIEQVTFAANSDITRRSLNHGQDVNPGRMKVMKYQLNSEERKELCEIQGIEYSYESIFSEVDPLILPEVLALVGSIHGTTPLVQRNQKQTELFRMLVTVASDLSSIVNRPAFIRQKIEDNEAQVVALGIKYEREVAALNTKKLELKRELESLQSKETTKDKEVQEDEKLSGKKRDRS